MTALINVIGNGYIVHASDSLRNQTLNNAGQLTHHLIEGGSKTVRFSQFRGAMSVFGLMHLNGWDVIDWLTEEANRAVERNLTSAAHFAHRIESRLRNIFFAHNVTQHSIGIHFTAYEWKNGQWIPEFFFITNFRGITGDTHHYVGGLQLAHQRQTFFTLSNETRNDFERHGRASIRSRVGHALQENGLTLIYQNGDPSLFEAEYVPQYLELANLVPGNLPDYHASMHHALAKIQAIANIHALRPAAQRRVGGSCQGLLIRPDTDVIFESSTGLENIPGA